MTSFNYVFGSLITEEVIQEIPLYGVYMDMEINTGGQFQGTFQLDQTGKDNAALLDACIPGRTWVACERNGVCIWHGFVWSRVFSAQSKSVQLFCSSFEHYPQKRLITEDLSFLGIEQRNIFRSLWTTMQSATNGNLNINIPASFSTVVTKDLTILASDFKYYDEAMSELSDSSTGFDWYIDVTKDGTHYRKNLLIGYPTLGKVETADTLVFDYPGNIVQYYFTEGMTDAGTNVYVIGSGEGSSMIVGHYDNTVMYGQGWPRWDVDITRKDVDRQSVVDDMAIQQSVIKRPPMPVIKISVIGRGNPEFGSYRIGDVCTISIKDSRFPSGFIVNKRLLKWELRPQSSENTEEANLVFEGDPDV